MATDAAARRRVGPGATIPSAGVVVPGDHLRRAAANDPPVIARALRRRHVLDLRGVDPDDDAVDRRRAAASGAATPRV